MKGRVCLSWRDYLFLLVAVVFMFGCVASSHRSGKTLEPGQVSFGGGYDGLMNLEHPEADLVHLIALDGRLGVVRGFDIGAAHTWDLTSGTDGAFNTWWGDAKFQLSNRDNDPGTPIFTLGLIKGYVYHENAKAHITSFPVILSIPTSDTRTSYFMYRFENITEDFFPDLLSNTRHGFFVGGEMEMGGVQQYSFIPVIGADVGLMTSLGGGEGDMVFVFNVGVSFKTAP